MNVVVLYRLMLPCALKDAGLEPDVAKRIVMAPWMLHGLRFGGKPGQKSLCFFRVKWLRPAMKGNSCVRRVRLGSNRASSSVFCNEWLLMCA